MGVLDKNASQKHRTKVRTLFCLSNIQDGPLEDIPGDHVGNFMLIMSYTMLSRECMPTSQIGSSTCLVPSCEEILGDDVEKQLCGVVHDKNTNKYSV